MQGYQLQLLLAMLRRLLNTHGLGMWQGIHMARVMLMIGGRLRLWFLQQHPAGRALVQLLHQLNWIGV